MSLMVEDWRWACLLTFVQVFASWSLNYVATSIESPFGDGHNDLPLLDMQQEFNNSLATLLMREAMQPPVFNFCRTAHKEVKIQSVDHMGIADPTALKDMDGESQRVLRVLRQFSLATEFEAGADESTMVLPGLAKGQSLHSSLFPRMVSMASSRAASHYVKRKSSLASMSSMESAGSSTTHASGSAGSSDGQLDKNI